MSRHGGINRRMTDGERFDLAVNGIFDKRLTFDQLTRKKRKRESCRTTSRRRDATKSLQRQTSILRSVLSKPSSAAFAEIFYFSAFPRDEVLWIKQDLRVSFFDTDPPFVSLFEMKVTCGKITAVGLKTGHLHKNSALLCSAFQFFTGWIHHFALILSRGFLTMAGLSPLSLAEGC